MHGFSLKQGFNTFRAAVSAEEREAEIKRRGERVKVHVRHARLPWRMTLDGRNRVWLVDALGVRVPMHAGNIKLILRALAALEEQGE